MKKLVDLWQIDEDVAKQFEFQIEEANQTDPVVDGEIILARVQGPAFFPNGASRNKRLYPLEAWQNAIADPDLIRKLNRRLVFGTVGHDQPLDDKAIREGLWSHIVTRVWIDEETGVGMAEFLIGNTGPGRSLNTALRMGSKLYVSTRASGDFQRRRVDGNQVVDPNKFVLKTIDFVLDPGFFEADPELVESLTEEDEMPDQTNDQLTQHLNNELTQVRGERNTLSEELATARSDLSKFEALGSVEQIREALSIQSKLTAAGKSLDEALAGPQTDEEMVAKLEEAQNALKVYEALGTPADIQESLKAHMSVIEELGTQEQIREALESYLDLLKVHGSKAEIAESLAQKARFEAEFGTEQELREALTASLDHFRAHGSASQIQENLDALARITEELGSEEEIREALSASHEFVMSVNESKKKTEVARIAEAYNIDEAKVSKLLDANFSEEEIAESFTVPRRKMRHQVSGRDMLEDKQDKANLNENKSPTSSRLSRIMG